MKLKPWMAILVFFFASSCFAGVARIFGAPELKLTSQSGTPKIRVKVLKEQKEVLISGTDLTRTFYSRPISDSFTGRKQVKFDCSKLSSLKFKKKPILLASLGSPTGLISLVDQKYRGDLHIISHPQGGKCDVVQEVRLDDYVSNLLAKEMNAKWPLEVLKAQAVAARSYALHKIETNQVSKNLGFESYFHLENSEKYQVGGSFFDSTARTDRASKETEGMILTNPQGKVQPIFFHARCGGRTLEPHHVWENKVKGYSEVICPRCRLSEKGSFNKGLTQHRMKKFFHWLSRKGHLALNSKVNFKDFKLVEDRKYNRYLRFYMEGKLYRLKKSWFRKYFGRFDIPSNNFRLTSNQSYSQFFVNGKGHGHGVGMCQVGALDLAKKGWDYKKILNHYYPNFKLVKKY